MTKLNEPPKKVRQLSKKEFANYVGLKNSSSIRRRYEMYLFIVGKPVNAFLTNMDVFKVDDYIIE